MTDYAYFSNYYKTDGTTIATLGSSDTLFVAQGATVGSYGAAHAAAFVINGGSVVLQGGIYGAGDYALDTSSFTRIAIGTAGSISGLNGVHSSGTGSSLFLNNAGSIATTASAIYATNEVSSVINSGSISSSYSAAVSLSGDGSSVSNSGTISSGDDHAVVMSGSGSTLVNSGTITARQFNIYYYAVQMSATNGVGAHLDNSGTISQTHGTNAVSTTGLDDVVTNSGTIVGDVALGAGGDSYDGHAGHTIGIVYGGDGNDQLIGSDTGNDVLDGGAGADDLVGGGGLDVASYADVVSNTSIGITADLQLAYKNTGDAAGDTYSSIEGLRGSNYDDILSGDTGANRIRGGDGDDQLFGRDGNDVLQGDGGNDVLTGSAGNDRMDGGTESDTASYADATAGVTVSLAITGAQNTVGAGADTLLNIENLAGSAFADKLTAAATGSGINGGAGNDVIYGGAAGDYLDGGLGADQLYGNGGQDTFAFTTAISNATFDTIHDFVVADDTIYLSHSIFAAAGAPGVLAAAAFYVGTAAHDGDDRIVYNDLTGALYYDADGTGSGAAIEFALVGKHLTITANDFLVIAA